MPRKVSRMLKANGEAVNRKSKSKIDDVQVTMKDAFDVPAKSRSTDHAAAWSEQQTRTPRLVHCSARASIFWCSPPARSRTRVPDSSPGDQIVGVGHRICGWQRLAMGEEGAISRTRHDVKPRPDTHTLK